MNSLALAKTLILAMKTSFSRVILVGCGGIARAHAAAIGAANIVALCDLNREAARHLQIGFAPDAPLYDSLDAALRCSHGDAVVVCTPPTTHIALATRAILEGVAVLCEKPLATRASDAKMLVELAAIREVKLRTSAKYRFAAGVEIAKNWAELGELKRIQIAFGAPFPYAHSWHANQKLSGGGVWMDNGPHALDLARFFAGELEVCAVENWRCDGDLETEVGVVLRNKNGVAIHIELSWLRGLGDWLAILEGKGGMLKIGWREVLWQPARGKSQVLQIGYDKNSCFIEQWRSFCEGDGRLDADNGARVVELLQAVYEIARQ